MVFESIVKELLNRYLGEYVENLDANQLNVGIWSGNVELTDLTLKRDALKDLDLPIEVVYGYLGKLSLKIPWKNLYTAPVEAVVERLYVLAKPSKSVPFDADKDEQRTLAEKRGKLKLIEESNAAKAAVDKLKTDKSFMEKMIVQIVNNIQIRISDIHIRYEDGSTASNLFAFGLTLKSFHVHTTDAGWQETYVKDQSSKTFKVANLNGLAVYMNCATDSFDRHEGKGLLSLFKSTIGESEGRQPPDYNYIFGPISSDTRLKLNSTPQDDEPPFGVPKVELTIAMHRVTLGVTRHQYQNVIALAENLDRSLKGAPFRRYRPHNVPVKGHAKQWWLFAYQAVAAPIRRRRTEWTWEHMAEVRHMCRKYEVALKAKRISRKPSPENLAICEEMETRLDLFNLIRIQNMVDIVVAKLEPEPPQKSGWFSSWFGGGSGEKSDDKCGNQAIMAQLGAAMTSDEKQKLFNAIGYQEQATPLELPKEFVAVSLFFELNLLEVVIRNEYLDLSTVGSVNDSLEIDDPNRVILLQLRKVRMNLDQRPGAAAMNLSLRLGDMGVYGVRQGGRIPALVKSQTQTERDDQLVVNFETNPLDNTCDKSVRVRTRPLEIIFDGETILQLIKVFQPPADMNLSKIQDAAAIRVAGVKERSATGLEFILDSRPRLQIDVELMPIYFILPQKGVYDVAAHNSLIVSLGTLKLFSTPRTLDAVDDVHSMHREGHKSDDILQSVLDKCYDTFHLHVENVQVLFVQPGDNWVSVLLASAQTEMHVLEPTRFEFTAKVCLIGDDPRLPKTKCSGRLPYFGFRLSQNRFFDLVELLMSVPRPGGDEPAQPAAIMRKGSSLYQSTSSLASRLLENEKARVKKRDSGPKADSSLDAEEATQFTNLLVDFVVDEISITLLKSGGAASGASSPEEVFSTPVEDEVALVPPTGVESQNQLLVLKVQAIELAMRQRTHDSRVNLNLGGISLHQHFAPSVSTAGVIKIISTPKFEASSKEYLLRVEYLNTSRDSPDFATKVMSVEQMIHVDFSLFVLCLHQEGLLDMLRLADDIQTKLGALTAGTGPQDRVGSAGSPVSENKPSTGLAMIAEEGEEGEQVLAETQKRRSGAVVDSVQLKIILRMERVSILLDSVRRGIALVQVAHLNTSVVKKSAYTEIGVNLKDIIVKDMNPATRHPQILSVIDDAIDCTVVLYNLDETSSYNSDDMKIDLKMGGLRLVFVNWFIQSVLNFLDHFHAAQQAIASASAAAADAAKKNVVNAYEKATRLSLKVKIKAPLIIVPIDSQSMKALCLDLGLIRVSNQFSDHFVHERNAVIDEMKLELSDFKLFHAEMGAADEGSCCGSDTADDLHLRPAANYILVPTSFTLHILRNLSSSWFRDRPDLEVSGKINAININLEAKSYGLLMDILGRNLHEGAGERSMANAPGADTSAVAASASEDATSLVVAGKGRLALPETTAAPAEPTQPAKMGTFLKFAFALDSLVISLYTDVDVGLATCGIYVLSVKGSILANGSINLSLILYDIHLDDIREERKDTLTRYMARKVDRDEDKDKSMIDITCSLQSHSTFADIRISGFDLIISMDFLMRLSSFAAAPSGSSKPIQAPKAAVVAAPVQQSGLVVAAAAAEKKQMNVTITLEQPDIILMEKIDGKASNALILNFELHAKVRQEGAQQTIQGEMQNFNLHMCEFDMGRRSPVRYYIVRPVAISIQGSTPDQRGLKVAVAISDISISISPLILELVNRIIAQTTHRSDETLTEAAAVDHSDLWAPQPFDEDDHWYSQVETAQEAATVLRSGAPSETRNELCTLDMPSLVLKIETGYGNHTIPMLRLASKMHVNVRNWSSQIAVEGSLELGVSYYNSSMALWEPLLEPNEIVSPSGMTSQVPWALNLGVNLEENVDEVTNETYTLTKVRIYSPETLELTVTKSCLEVFQDLGVAFNEALKEEFTPPTITAPYSIQNDCGFDIVLNLREGSFHLHASHLPSAQAAVAQKRFVFKSSSAAAVPVRAEDVTEVTIPAGDSAYLELKAPDALPIASQTQPIDSTLLVQQEKFVHVQVGEITKTLKIPVHKSDRRYFPLYRDTQAEAWGIVSQVRLETGTTVLTLQGVVQITNHFATTIFVHRKRNDQFEQIHAIPPNSTFNVPLHTIYNTHRDWHFSLANYKPSVQGVYWKESPTDFGFKKVLHCDPEVSYEPFYIHVIRTRQELYFEHSSTYKMESVCYGFDLRPRVAIRNTLPIPIVISIAGCGVAKDHTAGELRAQTIQDMSVASNAGHHSGRHNIEDFLDCGEKVVGPGEQLHLPTVKLVRPGSDDHSRIVVRLVQYLEKDWSCTTAIPSDPQENSIWAFEAFDSVAEMSFSLGVHYEDQRGTLLLSLYCPFWMVNKTGLMLSYRLYGEGTLYHPPDHEGPVLFSYPGKNFFGKKKTSVRVDSGEWSDKFSMDVAGSSGMVTCPSDNRKYAIAVHNHLTEYSLTKTLTLLPYYVMVNKAAFDIEVQESSRPSDPWISIPANTVRPLWPKTDLNQVLRARCCDDPTNVSTGFRYTDVQITLLRLNNNARGGIYVDVGVTEGGVYITFTGYSQGNAPAVIVNNTDRVVHYFERGNVNRRAVMPKEQQLFTWNDPAGDRILYWQNRDDKTLVETDLQQDQAGFYNLPGESEASQQIYWVTFLDGLQRVLLFTRDQKSASELHLSEKFTKITQDVEVEILGIGLSLVNDTRNLEILYLGIASTEVVWEEKKKAYFKQMKRSDSHTIETKYQEHLLDQVTGGSSSHKTYAVDLSGVVVDFHQMQLIKRDKRRDIRRSFFPGFWFQQKKSPYQTSTHAKINRIQVDNQTPDPIFPVIFSPVSPPKSIAAGSEAKPFIEASIVERVIPYSTVKQYKYMTVLIQELHIKIDMDFLTEVLLLVSADESDEKREKRFVQQLGVIKEPLDSLVTTQTTQEQKHFYDLLHLGPLKVHVSFSMQQAEKQNLPPIFSGIGVTLTDVNDVVFRLAYFERNYQFLTQKKLTSEAVAHYTGQALKQLYVLVFGLDVLGNPYGLVVGIKRGVEDLFYEPFQGLIQGPEEFAQGLVLGVRSLFGHTVGGAAGAVSKITGAVGKGLATLTFDKDFQKKRRDQINKKPANMQEGLARSGKGLVMGVFDGVTGVITKPITGAKEEGVGGFFKGIGKGAVGLITKPTSGVIDFASGTFDTVRRATELLDEVGRLRPPRYLSSDNVVRPYSRRAAEGNKLLREVDKAKYATSDVFVHYETFADPRKVLLVSDQRILYCSKQEMLGAWSVEWTYRWGEVRTFEVTEHAVVALIKDVKKKLFGMVDNKKVILMDNEVKRLRLADTLNRMLANHSLNKPTI